MELEELMKFFYFKIGDVEKKVVEVELFLEGKKQRIEEFEE